MDTTSEIVFGCENLAMNTDEIKNRLRHVWQTDFLNYSIFLIKIFLNYLVVKSKKIARHQYLQFSPDAFVLDEPSSNLDSESSWDLEDIIKKMERIRKNGYYS